jgi:hypothetical protein
MTRGKVEASAAVADDRRGRIAGSRRLEMRDAEIRQILHDGFADPLHIPKSLIPEGYDYFWVRDSFVGNVDIARMAAMNKRGWEPVPADRHAQLMPINLPGRESPLSNYVHHRGLILCDRPSHWGDIEREIEQKASLESMITPAVAQSMVSEEARKAGWQTKVLQNETNVQQEFKTFKD